MASISKNQNGTKRLSFNDQQGKWHTIRLGAVTMKQAESVKSKVEAIVAARHMRVSFDAETARWLSDICDDIHSKLANTGIVLPRIKTTLDEYCNQFLVRVKVKVSTKRTMKQTTDALIKYFGRETDPVTITEDMVEDFAESMRKARLSPSTIDKRLKTARQIFKKMIPKMINENPFLEIKVTPTINEERNVYVERERVEKIIDSIPDPEWKLIIGLSRYCGLRAPSEILPLTWDCILWDKKRIIVKSPKDRTL